MLIILAIILIISHTKICISKNLYNLKLNMWEFQKISSKKSCHTCPATSRTHGESFLKTSLQASTVHMQAVEIARHMLGIYNTFSPSPSFLLFDRSTDRQEHTRPHAHCSPHTCVHSAQIRPHKGRQHQWRESR